jgi:hypothetical protein
MLANVSAENHRRLNRRWFHHAAIHAITARTKTSVQKTLPPADGGGTKGNGWRRGAPPDAATVVTFTVSVVVEVPAAVRGFGETVHMASKGAPPHVKFTLWLNPSSPVTPKVYDAVWPGATLAVVEDPEAAASVKSSPIPLSITFCGLLGALSVMLRVPVVFPAAVGLKVTDMVQLVPAPREVPQVLVCEKAPSTAMLEIFSAMPPMLLSVTD